MHPFLPLALCVPPLVNEDDLYVQAGAGFPIKLNKRSGDSIWHSLKDKGGMFGSAFSSPVIEEINGNQQVIVQTLNGSNLTGVNPKSGKEISCPK